ncbi:hypothetical protein PAHAL_7G172500 [Panicum hallii]|jgi:hypothetical protein|uniref:Uncharacterized protein n=1 Tax=Panicum hallii TaxID=206008 RepID=A0A2S3I768_9POAL|nr:hypothetical protein PAHAL_7G172500 [Panicum hallii]
MALDAEALRAAEAAGAGLGCGAGTAVPWSSGDGGGASPAAAPAGLPPAVLWSDDDRRMKQELVAWARAVASMVVRDYSIRC